MLTDPIQWRVKSQENCFLRLLIHQKNVDPSQRSVVLTQTRPIFQLTSFHRRLIHRSQTLIYDRLSIFLSHPNHAAHLIDSNLEIGQRHHESTAETRLVQGIIFNSPENSFPWLFITSHLWTSCCHFQPQMFFISLLPWKLQTEQKSMQTQVSLKNSAAFLSIARLRYCCLFWA